MRYRAFQPMIEAARPSAALWRLLAGSVTTIALMAGWVFSILGGVALIRGETVGGAARLVFGNGAETPAGALNFLLLIGGLAFATFFAARLWHRRTPGSLIGPGARTLRHFAIAALLTWTVVAAAGFLSSGHRDSLAPNMDAGSWMLWLVPGLLAVALQTGAEEIFFRGYLQSQLAARFRSPLLWLGAPAAVFGLAHFSAALPQGVAWAYVAFATFFGLIAGDLLARTGSLGAAWGLHFANNSIAVLVVATEGSVSGLGLFVDRVPLAAIDPLDPLILIDLLPLLFLWWLLRRILAR